MRPFAGRHVVLGVTGGIAAYKAIQIARDLTVEGALVDVVLTAGALEFVQPLSFEALTGRSVYSRAHAPADPLLHIRLARDADLVVVAPATADFIARAAAGMADDLLTTVLLATRAPVLVCPAMNDRMYLHALTQANLARLEQVGYATAGPAVGPLAWGEGEGPGRLLEPEEIVASCGRLLSANDTWSGRRVLVTAGPTREPIDPVRFIGNRSSGRMGYALAAAAWRRGAQVTLISGPSAVPPPFGPERVSVETADQMRHAVAELLPAADVLVMAAAVGDFKVADVASQKIKKSGGNVPQITLAPNPDILRSTRPLRPPQCVVVGFALETENMAEHAREKLLGKELDLLILNDAGENGAGFEVTTNRVTIFDRDGGVADLPLLSKGEVAEEILDRVELRLHGTAG
ncbi:MAG: bifunctional phosphopantothenoylcysteine decarboxylase/phosphopantothenate--cysteine ligase CoaBC [Gemmatimonadetes bacterium]|nr:bifunctional phosphopantothenoylcysteine decarboxylase/phosphopantothenate--cysteine ligase CoaBC [Gemmatimonadota bacterium]